MSCTFLLTIPGANAFDVRAKALLHGPYNSSDQLMRDSLRELSYIPLSEPYSSIGFTASNNGATTTTQVLSITGNDAIVDWVYVELRSDSFPEYPVQGRFALIQRDGDIVDVDGVSSLPFTAPEGRYHVLVSHKNHLPLLSVFAQDTATGTINADFTSPSFPVFGGPSGSNGITISGELIHADGHRLMRAGDVNGDYIVKYTGSGNDRDPILVMLNNSCQSHWNMQAILQQRSGKLQTSVTSKTTTTSTQTTTLQKTSGTKTTIDSRSQRSSDSICYGYFREDVNLDGSVKYTGANNDRDFIFSSIDIESPNSLVVATLPGLSGDFIGPTTPNLISATAINDIQAELTWQASQDFEYGVAGYYIYEVGNSFPVDFVAAPATTATISGLQAGTAYMFYIRAVDYALNFSNQSSFQSTTTLTYPNAVNDSYSVMENQSVTFDVLTNDTLAGGILLIQTLPSNGNLTDNGGGSFIYEPNTNYSGSDSFSYALQNSLGTVYATVSITVIETPNQAPNATNDSYSMNQDSVLTIAAPGLLSNDTDADGDSIYRSDNTQPSHGTVSVNTNGGFTYTPNSGYTGSDSFTYTVSDGSLTDSATVNITINSVQSGEVVSFPSNNASKLSVTAFATVQSSPTQITLHWGNIDGVSLNTATIYRKTKTQTTWTQIGTTAGSNNQYTDSTAVVGTYYEYKIQIPNSSGVTAYGYVASGIEVPVVENRGKLILLIDTTVANLSGMATRLETLRDDLKSEGWSLIEITMPSSVTAMKTAIVNAYNADPSNVKGVFLIGHAPVARSGLNFGPDGHFDNKGAWPADGYYSDINGTWTDSGTYNNNNNSTTTDPLDNMPGDGKFDENNFPSSLELQIGRVDFQWMDEFSTNYGIEHDPVLYNAYFDRLHNYKAKVSDPQNRAFIQDNFTDYNFAQSGFKNFSSLVGNSNITSRTGGSPTMFSALNNQSYLFAYGCGGGSALSSSGIANVGELANGNWGGVFNFTFGSYFGQWMGNNNFLRAMITGGSGLTNMWVGGTQGYFHHMGMGDTIGYSAQATMNNKISQIYYPETGGTGTGIGSYDNVELSLMGDPTLRLGVIAPPTNFEVNISGNLLFSWSAPAGESGVSYLVYEVGANGGLTRVTPNPITETFYQSTINNSVQNKRYIVKTYRLVTSQSGSYYNTSIGSNVVTR